MALCVVRDGIHRLNYERRVALADRGWSLVGVLAGALALYLLLGPQDRPDVTVFFGEPLPSLLAGFLASRLVMPDYAARRLPFLVTRRGLLRIWALRFALLMAGVFLFALVHGLLVYLFPPHPWDGYFAHLPVTGFAAALFFAASSSFLALVFRQSQAGDLWTLFWSLLSLLMIFPARDAAHTGLGPLFPFPIWFIHRRLSFLPQLRPVLLASERVPAHLAALTLASAVLVLLHVWALRRLQRQGL